MAQATHITRYRPAVLAVAGVAAGYSIYLIYNAYLTRPAKDQMHRCNAVRRPRSERSRATVDFQPPDHFETEAVLGSIVIRRGDGIVSTDLPLLPSYDAIADTFGDVGDLREELITAAVNGILKHCVAPSSPWQSPALRRLGLEGIRGSPRDLLLGPLADRLAVLLANGDRTVIDRAVEEHIANEDAVTSPVSDPVNVAETEDFEGFDGPLQEPSQGLKGLLYYIAEDNEKMRSYEHRGINCEECGEAPIRGVRWHCLNCPDYDLCSTCESQTVHPKTHVFGKIKIPLPVLSQPTVQYPIWYPGDHRIPHRPLDAGLRKRLAEVHGFAESSIDALYDQFTCIARTEHPDVTAGIGVTIDRTTFDQALTTPRWAHRFKSNSLYDRMFSFYDTEGIGLISFENFCGGLAYLRGPMRFSPLKRAVEGFDVDEDGFVDRSDFLRMFRAKYAVQRQLVSDMVDGHQSQLTAAARDILESSQPISAMFTDEEIPQGMIRPTRGKAVDALGDMQPLPGVKTILSDNDPWPTDNGAVQTDEREVAELSMLNEDLRQRVARAEEILYGPSDHAQPAADSSGPSTVFDHDALWQIVEDGFNSMLDPLFSEVEIEGVEAVSTRDERELWRREIDQFVAEQQAFMDTLETDAMLDPLMATARSSLPLVQIQRQSQQASQRPLRGGVVPTDLESLARREAAIAQLPLNQLLDVTGYGTVQDLDDAGSRVSSDETEVSGATETSADPTLPHLRPHAVPTERPPPSQERMHRLSCLDAVDRRTSERGGPGRLSFEEIEDMVRDDTTKELRGLVTSWLEWASF